MIGQTQPKRDAQETKQSNKSEKKKESVIIIALNPRDDPEEFKKLSADDKLKKVLHATKTAYEKIKVKCPDAKKIIICWREHTITESTHQAVDQQFAKKVKKSLNKITKDNPDLVIIAGGMLIKKENILKAPYTKTIMESYNHYGKKFAENIKEIDDKHFLKYSEKATTVLIRDSSDRFTKTKNNLYVFYRDTKLRHGKLIPMHEFKKDKDLKKSVFQLGKGVNNDSAIVRLPELPSMFVQTCREHFFLDNDENVDLQFILSDSIFARADKMTHTRMAIHVDSIDGVKAFEMSKMDNVEVYQFNFLTDESFNHITPIEPLYFKLLPSINRMEVELKHSFRTIAQFKKCAQCACIEMHGLLKLGELLGKLFSGSSSNTKNFDDIRKILHDHAFTIIDDEERAQTIIKLIDSQIEEGKSSNSSNLFSNFYISESAEKAPFLYKQNLSSPSSRNEDEKKTVEDTSKDVFDTDIGELSLDDQLYLQVSMHDGSSDSLQKIKELLAEGANPNYAPDKDAPHLTTLYVAEQHNHELVPLLKRQISNLTR